MIRKFFKLTGYFLLLSIVVVFTTIFIDQLVEKKTSEKIYHSIESLPKNKVGLVLGTIKYLPNGRINLYYKYRVEAAARLYNAGKIDYLLISGDNSNSAYDEPTTFKNDLIAKGIPADKIYLDYAGFRTLDSVIRCKKIFGQDSFTVISQQFHNERAIYIANWHGIEAVGYNAKDLSFRYGFKVQLREKLARVKMIFDLIVGKNPKFLGEKVEIN